MKTSVRTYSIVSLVLVFCALAVPAQAQTVKPIDTITIAELRDHIFYLASDDLEGRYTGSKGYEIAAKYCASQFLAAGLAGFIALQPGRTVILLGILGWSILLFLSSYAPFVTVRSTMGTEEDMGQHNQPYGFPVAYFRKTEYLRHKSVPQPFYENTEYYGKQRYAYYSQKYKACYFQHL